MFKFLAALAVVGLTLTTAAHATQSDPWGEDYREWECAMPPSRDGDKDPVYKTEIFVTYQESGEYPSAKIATFNVRHTTVAGQMYDRPEQYYVTRFTNGRLSQTWTGVLKRNPSQQIVGEVKYTKMVYSDAAGARVPAAATYTEKVFKDGKLFATSVAKCHWTGMSC
jgi:hypothetical protein